MIGGTLTLPVLDLTPRMLPRSPGTSRSPASPSHPSVSHAAHTFDKTFPEEGWQVQETNLWDCPVTMVKTANSKQRRDTGPAIPIAAFPNHLNPVKNRTPRRWLLCRPSPWRFRYHGYPLLKRPNDSCKQTRYRPQRHASGACGGWEVAPARMHPSTRCLAAYRASPLVGRETDGARGRGGRHVPVSLFDVTVRY